MGSLLSHASGKLCESLPGTLYRQFAKGLPIDKETFAWPLQPLKANAL
jgi:hypothetical protein